MISSWRVRIALLGTVMALLLITVTLWPAAPQTGCDADTLTQEIRQGPLRQMLTQARFVTYQPTGLQVRWGSVTQADRASIRQDLWHLRPWFDGLVTYTAINGGELIPEIAQSLGYRAVIVGIWDPADRQEVANALDLARTYPGFVVGIIVGNETVFGQRGDWQDLAEAIARIRRSANAIALSTSEPFAVLVDGEGAAFARQLDFLAPNVHPVFEPWFAGAPAFNRAEFVVRVVDKLKGVTCGPILVKETGVPTAPADLGFDEAQQTAFYRELEKQFPPSADAAFSYFSAFDAPWRLEDVHPVPGDHRHEAHWGLFTHERKAKPVMRDLQTRETP